MNPISHIFTSTYRVKWLKSKLTQTVKINIDENNLKLWKIRTKTWSLLIVHFTNEIMIPKMSYVTFHWLWLWSMSTSSIFGKLFSFSQTVYKWTLWILLKSVLRLSMTPQFWLNWRHLLKPHLWPKITRQLLFYLWFPQLLPH